MLHNNSLKLILWNPNLTHNERVKSIKLLKENDRIKLEIPR
jgi:hypothetical protein